MATIGTNSALTKKVDSYIALQTETNLLKTLYSGLDSGNNVIKDLTFTLCDRTDTSTKYGNYFVSFNLPTDYTHYSITGSCQMTNQSVFKKYPELAQINVDKIVMCPIPNAYYSEFIDGKTITFSVPQNGGADQDNMSAVTLISSTYSSENISSSESSPILGDNIVFLFSDTINVPYSGESYASDGLGDVLDNSDHTSWDPTGVYSDRPSAVSFIEVNPKVIGINKNALVNTDTRTNAHFAVTVPSKYPGNFDGIHTQLGLDGYNYDIPVGFVSLDKGFLVITHTGITENIPWTSGYTYNNDQIYVTGTKANIYFTGTTTPSGTEAGIVTFKDIDTAFKMSTVCLAMPREFYISNNPTWDRSKVITQQQNPSGIINYDSVYVSEIGLYNAYGELIAISKLSEPVEKSYTNVITFNVDIQM